MKKIKHILFVFLLLIASLNAGTQDSRAACSVSISAPSSAKVGDAVNVSVSISGSDICAYTVYVSYNASVLQYVSGSGATVGGGGGTVTISGTSAATISLSFKAIANGSSSISSSGEFYDINLAQISTTYGGASVTVSDPAPQQPGGNNNNNNNNNNTTQTTTEQGPSTNCTLYSLEVNPGELSPEFSGSVTSYKLKVSEDTKSIEVLAYPVHAKATCSIEGNDDIKPGENVVTITVKAESGDKKTYTINVFAGTTIEDIEVAYNNVGYHFVTDFSFLETSGGDPVEEYIKVPDGFEQTSVKYDKWDITAFASPNKKIVLLCLQDENLKMSWFVYDEVSGELSPYVEFTGKNNRYFIKNMPQNITLSEDFVLKDVKINGNTYSAYWSEAFGNGNYYLVYAINVDGEEGLYIYDIVEGNLLRYEKGATPTDAEDEIIATLTDATPTDAVDTDDGGFFTKQNFIIGSIAAGVIVLILLIWLICCGVKLKKLNKELDEKAIAELVGEMRAEDNDLAGEEPIETVGEETASIEETTETFEEETASVEKTTEIFEEETVSVEETTEEAETIALGEVTETSGEEIAVLEEETEEAETIDSEETTEISVGETEEVETASTEEATEGTESIATEEIAEEIAEDIPAPRKTTIILEDAEEISMDEDEFTADKIPNNYNPELDSAFDIVNEIDEDKK